MFYIVYNETGDIEKVFNTCKEALAYTDKERKEKSFRQFDILATNNISRLYTDVNGYDYQAERYGLN